MEEKPEKLSREAIIIGVLNEIEELLGDPSALGRSADEDFELFLSELKINRDARRRAEHATPPKN